MRLVRIDYFCVLSYEKDNCTGLSVDTGIAYIVFVEAGSFAVPDFHFTKLSILFQNPRVINPTMAEQKATIKTLVAVFFDVFIRSINSSMN